MTPEQWLSRRVKESGIRQRFIVAKSGIDDFTENRFSFSLCGRRRIRVDEFLAVCRVIGANPMEYLDAKGEATSA